MASRGHMRTALSALALANLAEFSRIDFQENRKCIRCFALERMQILFLGTREVFQDSVLVARQGAQFGLRPRTEPDEPFLAVERIEQSANTQIKWSISVYAVPDLEPIALDTTSDSRKSIATVHEEYLQNLEDVGDAPTGG